MTSTSTHDFTIGKDDPILVTGATGFIGSNLVENLLQKGFRNIRCFARSGTNARLLPLRERYKAATIELIRGNLLSPEDCAAAVQNVTVIYHLAAGRGEKFFPDAFINSVVTTRNLLDACVKTKSLKRFVNISSFIVYTNVQKHRWRLLDESCPIETHPSLRGDAYCFAKVKQDEIVAEYSENFSIPYVTVRPGHVYGPGNLGISGRVGIDISGMFLNLSGSNSIPLTYVDNCVEAIALAGIVRGVEGQVFNVVDDDLPSGREFLRLYKKNVKRFKSVYVPHSISYLVCYLWEKYSASSNGQLPPAFNRMKWHAFWKKTRYDNDKLKTQLDWKPLVSTEQGLSRYFAACRAGVNDA